MSSMMETMTTTRKAMWRFKSSWACCTPRNSFLPLDWVGGKRCGSPSSGVVTFTGFTDAGELFGGHILFSNQVSSFCSFAMVPTWDWMGTKIVISRTSWAVGPDASPCPSGPFIPYRLPSKPVRGRSNQDWDGLWLHLSWALLHRPCFQCRWRVRDFRGLWFPNTLAPNDGKYVFWVGGGCENVLFWLLALCPFYHCFYPINQVGIFLYLSGQS